MLLKGIPVLTLTTPFSAHSFVRIALVVAARVPTCVSLTFEKTLGIAWPGESRYLKCDMSICVLLWYERNWIIMNNCSYGYSLQHFMSFCTKSSYFPVTVLRLGFEQATSHYPNQWWPSSLTYICVTGPKWVKLQTHCHHSCKSLYVNKTHIQDEHFHHNAWWLIRITHTKITILMVYSIDWWLWYSWDVFHICRWNDERSPHWTGFRRRIKHELIPKFMLNTKIAE